MAGVIGVTKFAYDLWRDMVNTASRMEPHGVPGRIQVARSMFERLREQHHFEERGEIEVKGKGGTILAHASEWLRGRYVT
jgi:class 3 adenylate cyclase